MRGRGAMDKRILRGALAAFCLFALLLSDAAPLSVVPSASAVTQADIDARQAEKKKLEAQKTELQSQLKSLQKEKSSALAQKTNLDTQIAVIRSEVATVEELIAQYETLIAQTEAEIADTQQKHDEQFALFRARVRAMEERGTVSYWSVLFHSADFSEMLAAMDFIGEIMASDQRVIDDLKATEERLAAEQAELEGHLAEQQAARAELAARNAELSERRQAAQSIITSLAANEAEYKQLIAEKEAAALKEQEEIQRLSRELAAQQGGVATKGGYIWPCSSHYVTSPLGSRYTGIKGASTNHMGIDIGRVGYTTQAVAAKAGTVIISSYNQYRGNYVVVSHGSGNTTTYQHLSKRSVNVGDFVAQGQVVGITGATGVSSGPHLHFEISENGQIVNPLNYLTDYIKGW
ncbi:MAG: peptidoglycan DD-metalloendopeptidase family protein [Oscillospiraceae bacterium]|nr:peptidoglycan DD-metalloendopeptidase family protein [Oscillospiraceae bacterium]